MIGGLVGRYFFGKAFDAGDVDCLGEENPMINKLICHFMGHNFFHDCPYKFKEIDGLMKVFIKSHLLCNQCKCLVKRETEPYEWPMIANGYAILED